MTGRLDRADSESSEKIAPGASHTRGGAPPRVGIILSAGYFGFFAHAGFMLAVEELGIDYCAIAGSSAGAIVAALHASGVPAAEIVEMLVALRREQVWDSVGVSGILRAVARRGRGWTGWLRGELFEQTVERHLRAKSFDQCPRSLYITAFNLTKGRDETFDSGTIADKVRASCSYPFLMSTKRIGGSEYWDGGFLAKVPAETLMEREKPDRVIVHYLPTQDGGLAPAERNWSAIALMERALTAARREIERHRLEALGHLRQKMVWIEPVVPAVGPKTLSEGRAAVEAAHGNALGRLAQLKQELTL
jgi:NTE family protein